MKHALVRAPLLLAGLLGCGPVIGTPPVIEDPRELVVEARETPIREVDLLFVIDNSNGMTNKQHRLAEDLPKLLNALGSVSGGMPDLHIGVISTDMGTTSTAGTTLVAPLGTVGQGGCGGTGTAGRLLLGQATGVTGAFLSDIELTDGSRHTNYTGDLATALGAMTSLGATGCGFEQPLHAMRAALSDNQANTGFLRETALLSVVFLTDEDDCSMRDAALLGPDSSGTNPLESFRCTRFGVTCEDGGNTPDEMNTPGPKGRCGPNTSDTSLLDDPSLFHDFLVDLKGDPTRVIVGGIIGPADSVAVETRTIAGTPQPALAHACGIAGAPEDDRADPGVRLTSFFDLFPDRSASTSICQPSYAQALEDTAHLLGRASGTPCIRQRLADIDPSPGLQPDCLVEDAIGATATAIPPCSDSAGATCWRLVADGFECPTADHLRLDVVRTAPAPPETVTRARCRTE